MQETERSESQASRTTSRPDWLNLNVLIKKEKEKKQRQTNRISNLRDFFSYKFNPRPIGAEDLLS